MAGGLRSSALSQAVHQAFFAGLDRVLWATAAIACCGTLPAPLVLPRATARPAGRIVP